MPQGKPDTKSKSNLLLKLTILQTKLKKLQTLSSIPITELFLTITASFRPGASGPSAQKPVARIHTNFVRGLVSVHIKQCVSRGHSRENTARWTLVQVNVTFIRK
jgi:hypothetical protein